MKSAYLAVAFGAFGALFATGVGITAGCSSSSSNTNPGPTGTDSGIAPATDSGVAPATDSGTPPVGDSGTPVGDGGTPAVSCADYCTTILMACGAADGGATNTQEYYDNTNCMNTCAVLPLGTYGDMGDTVGCRQAHAHLALTDTTQCEAAGQSGGNVCGMRCDDYCAIEQAQCTVANGANPPFASLADCQAACAAYPYSTTGLDYDQNAIGSLNCLEYHLRESFSDLPGQGIAGGHCDDQSIDGGTTRGACHP